jgi:hypothetical protein
MVISYGVVSVNQSPEWGGRSSAGAVRSVSEGEDREMRDERDAIE